MSKNTADDQPFQHFSLKHKIVSWVSRNLFDHITYTVRHGLLTGMKRKGGLGWLPAKLSGGELVSEEQRFLASLDLEGKVVYDVGAFEGLIGLYFATKARQVFCYEPNPRNARRIRENMQVNCLTNVTIRPFGVGETAGRAEMVWDSALAGAGAIADTSMAKAVAAKKTVRTEQIEITTLAREVAEANIPAPDFIKVDTEGYELSVLKGARPLLESDRRPALYLEMHGETMAEKHANVRAIVILLKDSGYKIQHVESGEWITPENCESAARGHLYAT